MTQPRSPVPILAGASLALSGLASADAPESGDAGAVEVALALRAVGRVVLAGVDSCMSSFPMPSLASLPANRPF